MEKNSPYLLGSLDTFLILFSLSAIVISYQIFQWLPDRYPILNWPLPGIAMIEDIPLPFLPSIPLWKVWLSLIPITLITSVWCLYFQRQQRHVAPGIYIIFAFWAALIYLHNHLTLPILTIDPRASLTQYLHTLQQAHQPQAIQLRLLQPSPHKPDSALQDVALTLMHKPGFSVLWYSGNLAELPPCPKQTRCIGMFQLESFLEFNVPQKNQWQLFEKTWRQWTPLQDDTLPSEASIIILAEQLPQIP